ncbi:hypothetical protein ACS5PU_03985 [Pedobacter sp. GSP4]|uniref:hypothetical protein n=1 Tax=Pedobacter sp. GSP4 TaxID=3453716 RepID=UPI003EEEDD5C
MPVTPLSEADLIVFEDQLANKDKSIQEHFSVLTNLYQRFELNEQALGKFEHLASAQRIKNDYELKKSHWDGELAELKKQFKLLDNRIVAAEQKLSRGIPDDLLIMEKLITEQELIVADQEKLNQAEAALISHVREIDIEYGKQQEKLNQQKAQNGTSEKIDVKAKISQIKATEKKLKLKVNLFTLLPILGIPLIIDYLTSSIGILSTKQGHSLLTGHLFFLVTLILIELFLGDKIRKFVSFYFASSYLKTQLNLLQQYTSENQQSIKRLENTYKIKMPEIN